MAATARGPDRIPACRGRPELDVLGIAGGEDRAIRTARGRQCLRLGTASGLSFPPAPGCRYRPARPDPRKGCPPEGTRSAAPVGRHAQRSEHGAVGFVASAAGQPGREAMRPKRRLHGPCKNSTCRESANCLLCHCPGCGERPDRRVPVRGTAGSRHWRLVVACLRDSAILPGSRSQARRRHAGCLLDHILDSVEFRRADDA